MTNEEFLEKIKITNINCEEFNKEFKVFLKYQKLALDTLREFHRVSVESDISYQLSYGSLLGAIRDNGQIPWDYDVDVFVPFNERERLIEALKENLNTDYYFYSPEYDEKCRHFFCRLAPKGFNTDALHVDIFYLVGIPNGENNEKYTKKIRRLANCRYKKLVKFSEIESKNILKKVSKYILFRTLNLNISMKSLTRKFNYLCNKCNYDDVEYFSTGDTFSGDYIFEKSEIEERVLYITREGEFYIPKNYDAILKKVYGDYKKYPSIDDCIAEVKTNYKKLCLRCPLD